MKKTHSILYILLTFFLCLALPQISNAKNVEFVTEWFSYTDVDDNNIEKLVLTLEADFKNDAYTYAPTYKDYPTSFTLNHEYSLYSPKVTASYDPLTKKELLLYKEKVQYFLFYEDMPHEIDEKLNISLLMCTPINCTPYKESIKLEIPKNKDALPRLEESGLYTLFQNSEALVINKINDKSSEKTNLSIVSLNSESAVTKQDVSTNPVSTVALPLSSANESSYDFDFSPQSATQALEVKSFSFALLLGFFAGFILNLMPCVLPVIAIKIASLVQASQHDIATQNKLVRVHGIFFALGVLTLFTILAILFGVFDIIWGGLFQNVYFIIFLAGFIFMLGLSFVGLFTFPLMNIRSPKSSRAWIDSYFQGLMTTLIATPCSGPLLGGVLGFSLVLPLPLLILVFVSTGLGMAAPYLVLSIFPQFIRFIPKSGNWMGTMEKVLAFFLFATTVYLLSFIPNEMLYKSVIYIFLVALFLWIYTFFQNKKNALLWASVIFIVHTACSYALFRPIDDENSLAWHTYSYSEFRSELGNTPMIVDFTADWCPTCKIIENTVLTYENIQPLVEEYNLKLVKVDLTYPNEENEALLKSLESASIPLLAMFPEGIFAYSPILLRDVFTLKQFKESLKLHF